MFFYIANSLCWPLNKSLRKKQFKVLMLISFSLAILVAISTIFSGLEYEFAKIFNHQDKVLVVYNKNADNFLENVPEIKKIERYSKTMVRVVCKNSSSLALAVLNLESQHSSVLVNSNLLFMLDGCLSDLKIINYDFSSIFPLAHSVKVKAKYSEALPNNLPVIYMSLNMIKKLNVVDDYQDTFIINIDRKYDFHAFEKKYLQGVKYLDMDIWHGDYVKALFAQKIIMWIVLGLLLFSSLMQLKYLLLSLLDSQKMFWSMCHIHNINKNFIFKVFFVFMFYYIALSCFISLPLGIGIAYGLDYLFYFLEYFLAIKVLDPSFFITDHLPVFIDWNDLFCLYAFFIVLAFYMLYRAILVHEKINIEMVIRND